MKLELKIDIDEINYAQAIRALLPYIKKEDLPIPDMVKNAAETPGVLENFLKFIPKSKQDEILLKVFEKNKVRIIAKAHRVAENRGVDVTISDITLTEQTDDVVVLG
ncbi:MAG: hypothetical protein PUI48_04860 [Oscillospiraceae bacterium]|nr:hypothetical protein [Oscillospiraceae bacterium]MDY6207487.1 hypothetical protein [Oscillospiraceae bacterium]